VRSRRGDVLPDLAWLVPVVLAVVATCATTDRLAVVAPLLAVAVVPWVLLALGRPPRTWLLVVVGTTPVVAILVLDELNASVFLGTTVLCLLASRADRTRQLVVLAAAGAVLPFASLWSRTPFNEGAFYFAIGNLFGIVVGMLLGHSRRLDAQLRTADARLAALSAQEERTRLARDVHDLVAHSLTVVVLQVGGARRVLRADPARAEQALEEAEQVCRESLDGIREVVGLLRAGDEAPGAAVDLLRLVETYRAAGVDVDLQTDDRTDALPLLVRGTLYRVVQEALANAARYRSPDSPVSVRTAVDGGGVTVSVSNAGSPGQRSGPGGYGLAGLREQVSAIGGTLRSGPAADRWVVECRLPQDVTARAGLVVR
jgi:signal transduction histidine kinase